MRRPNRGGHLFFDRAAKKVGVTYRRTGEIRSVQMFLAMLGGLDHTYIGPPAASNCGTR